QGDTALPDDGAQRPAQVLVQSHAPGNAVHGHADGMNGFLAHASVSIPVCGFVAQRGFAANSGIAVVRRWFGCGFAAPWGRPSFLVVCPGKADDENRSSAPRWRKSAARAKKQGFSSTGGSCLCSTARLRPKRQSRAGRVEKPFSRPS